MFGADGGDVAVQAIASLGIVAGALIACYGVIVTARRQLTPRVVEPDRDHHDPHALLEVERQLRVRAEAERDVWREVALRSKVRDSDSPDAH